MREGGSLDHPPIWSFGAKDVRAPSHIVYCQPITVIEGNSCLVGALSDPHPFNLGDKS